MGTGKERILASLSGAPVDSLPLMPITMMFAADLAGIPYLQYAQHHQALAEAQLRVAERFDFDHVSTISDPAREASDLGAVIQWFNDQPPAIVESRALLQDKQRLFSLKPVDLDAPGRMRDRIEGVRLLAARCGKDKLVEGWIEGPCALAGDLRGINTLMLDFHDDPAFVEDLFDFCIRLEIDFARAQVEAGATLIGIGDAAASLTGPNIYHRLIQPGEKRLVDAVHALQVPVRLHICGRTRPLLQGMGNTGADIVELDFLTPLDAARMILGEDRVLSGNIDPVRILRDGSPEGVEAALAECHHQAGKRYIVAAGCEVPRGTPHENLQAMTRFARNSR